MESAITVHIERLPEGLYLATSEDVPGLVAQGRTVAETLEIARDVARILIEEQHIGAGMKPVDDVLDYPLIVGL